MESDPAFLAYACAPAQRQFASRRDCNVVSYAGSRPLSPTGASPRPSLRAIATVAALARSLVTRIPEITERLVMAIYATDTAYRDRGLVAPDDLRRSCHDNLLEVITAISRLRSHHPDGRESARATGRRRAEQGLPLENLLHAYRLGGRVIWEALLEEGRRRPRPPLDDLMEGAVLVWDVIDLFSGEIADSYRQTEAELVSRDETTRLTLLHSLLTGMVTDADLALAAESLDLPGTGPYLVAVADPNGDASSPHRAPATALATQRIRSEWLTRNDRMVGLVALRGVSPDRVRECLAASGRRRIGLSPPVNVLGQVAGAFRQAELALKSIPPNRFEVASLDERLTDALLVASPELARRLARHVLGMILELDPRDRGLLLGTLRAYIAAHGSVGAAARRLSCHRNTVFNRIGRIEGLTGLSPADPSAMAQLTLALQATDLLSIEAELPGLATADEPGHDGTGPRRRRAR
jgi:hypothetical protein